MDWLIISVGGKMRRWSETFIPTLREAPVEAEVPSHKLLLRAGYVRQHAAGRFSYLFLGRRSMLKIAAVVRDEMDRIGQEISLPSFRTSEPVDAGAGRSMRPEAAGWEGGGRREATLVNLGHYELVADIARRDLRSYRQLPQVWYRIATGFEDEAHARLGLLELREFTVVDSYSFDIDGAGLDATYREHSAAYSRILNRCGLKYVVVDASVIGMNDAQAQSFVVYADNGADVVATCPQCAYAANVEVAGSGLQPTDDPEASSSAISEVATPTHKTIDDVAAFFGVQPARVIKSYLAVATSITSRPSKEFPIIAFLRGDHSVNETKLRSVLEQSGFVAEKIRSMEEDEIRDCFGLEPGFIGPVGLSDRLWPDPGSDVWMKPQLLFDFGLKGRRNLVAGANKLGFHLTNVTPNGSPGFLVRDKEWVDLRNVAEGEGCPRCGYSLAFKTAIRVGHIAKLSSAYARTTGVSVTDGNGREAVPRLGSYRLWLDRILAACIEQDHDKDGFWLSPALAPFGVVVTPTNPSDERIRNVAESIARRLEASGVEVLLDDRNERPGVKFKDADLSGIPYRINVGKRIDEEQVELFFRRSSTKRDVRVEDVVALVQQQLGAAPDKSGML